ncbi:hypothetical protein GLOIN_2v1780600 [Rhizophagus clarus]|uniref:Uncharacterized protein n=1 Tax=Rhizophagus clarus TaxID=94130 RepID=A0A8H3KTB1_9GLOM|nr:hypothetical protein GLOIN_2v1780600 [Rhizophagus clarus]
MKSGPDLVTQEALKNFRPPEIVNAVKEYANWKAGFRRKFSTHKTDRFDCRLFTFSISNENSDTVAEEQLPYDIIYQYYEAVNAGFEIYTYRESVDFEMLVSQMTEAEKVMENQRLIISELMKKVRDIY